jgi:hypothetical protein
MAIINIVDAGQTLDPAVIQYSLVYLDGTVWKKAIAGTTPEGVYEGFNIVVTSNSETTPPEVDIDFRFEPSGFGFISGDAIFVSNSAISPERVRLIGALVMQPRLYSYTGAPYGKIYLGTSLVDPKYQTTTMLAPQGYSSSAGVTLAQGDTYIRWYDCSTLIFTYAIDRDPYPYWNSTLAYPVELNTIAARLSRDIIEALIGTEPVYPYTGNFAIHAALTLYEYAARFSLPGLPALSSDPLLSWRAKNIKMIAEQNLIIRNQQYMKVYQNSSDMFSQVKTYVQDVIKTLYPKTV